MRRVCIHLSERQTQTLHLLSRQIGTPQAELLRRMIDHCCQDAVLNVLVPPMSGRLTAAQGGRQQ